MSDLSTRRATPLDWRFGLALAGVFFATLVPRVALHVPWRDEWHTWLLCRETPDLATLFARLRYDGHPATWYVLVWAISRLSTHVIAMQLAHAAIASAVVAIVGVASPFPRWQCVLLAFGYFFAFEYAVISRNYALGALGLLLAAACHARAPHRPIATCAALALAVHSNAFAAIAALAFAAYLASVWLGDGLVSRPRLAAALAIVAASAIGFAIEIRPPADFANTLWLFDFNVTRAAQLASSLWRTFAPLPPVRREWWNGNVLDFGVFRRVQCALGIVVLVATTLAVSRDRRLRIFWVATFSAIVLFAYLKIVGSLRHHGTMFVLFVALRWLDRVADPTPDRPRERFWSCVLIVQAVAGVFVSVVDLAMPFSAARATAAFIRGTYPDALVITQRDFEGGSIAGELGRPVWFPVPGRWATHVIYDDRRSERATAEQLDAAARTLHAADPTRPVVLVVSNESIDRPDEQTFLFVRTFASASASERYNVYSWQPTTRAFDDGANR